MLAIEELPEGRRLRKLRAMGSNLVTIFPSTIPNAGRGLFAFRTIPPFTEMAEYKGIFSTTPPLSSASPFTMELPEGAGYIIGDPSLCFGVFINDCFDDLLTNTRIRWCPARCRAFVVSGTLPINPGLLHMFWWGILVFRAATSLTVSGPSTARFTTLVRGVTLRSRPGWCRSGHL